MEDDPGPSFLDCGFNPSPIYDIALKEGDLIPDFGDVVAIPPHNS
jgi:hypothetical protein